MKGFEGSKVRRARRRARWHGTLTALLTGGAFVVGAAVPALVPAAGATTFSGQCTVGDGMAHFNPGVSFTSTQEAETVQIYTGAISDANKPGSPQNKDGSQNYGTASSADTCSGTLDGTQYGALNLKVTDLSGTGYYQCPAGAVQPATLKGTLQFYDPATNALLGSIPVTWKFITEASYIQNLDITGSGGGEATGSIDYNFELSDLSGSQNSCPPQDGGVTDVSLVNGTFSTSSALKGTSSPTTPSGQNPSGTSTPSGQYTPPSSNGSGNNHSGNSSSTTRHTTNKPVGKHRKHRATRKHKRYRKHRATRHKGHGKHRASKHKRHGKHRASRKHKGHRATGKHKRHARR